MKGMRSKTESEERRDKNSKMTRKRSWRIRQQGSGDKGVFVFFQLRAASWEDTSCFCGIKWDTSAYLGAGIYPSHHFGQNSPCAQFHNRDIKCFLTSATTPSLSLQALQHV